MKTKHFFMIQISNTILNQCISLSLYEIGHITKDIIGFKFKVIVYASQGDNSYICSENRQFIKNSNDCIDQILCLPLVERNVCQDKKIKHVLEKAPCKS